MFESISRFFTAVITAFTRTDANSVLQLQYKDRVTEGEDGEEGAYDSAYCDDFTAWCIIAPPGDPDVDADGNIDGAAECCALQDGDESTVIGTRDVRVQKFGADLKAGEPAFVNRWGSRLALKRYENTWSHGGGFITLTTVNPDVPGSKASLTIAPPPDAPGGQVPYVTFADGIVSVVSKSGKSSVVVDDDQVSVSGAAAAFDVGSVTLVKGGVDPVVTVSTLQPILAAIYAYLTLVGSSPAGTGAPPPVIATAVGSTRIKGSP